MYVSVDSTTQGDYEEYIKNFSLPGFPMKGEPNMEGL